MHILFLLILALVQGCAASTASDYSGTFPLAIGKADRTIWLASYWRQAASNDSPAKEEIRIHTSSVESPSTLTLNKSINIRLDPAWIPPIFPAALDFVGIDSEPQFWVMGKFNTGRELKVFSTKNGERAWKIPATVPELYDNMSLSVTHPSAERTWVTFKGTFNRTQGGLFEIDKTELRFFPGVVWARCHQGSCRFARVIDGKLTLYSLKSNENIDSAIKLHEQTVGVVLAICRDSEGHDRMIAGSSSYSLESTESSELLIQGFSELPADSQVFCGPASAKEANWFAISPNSSDTFIVSSTMGKTISPLHLDNNDFLDIETTNEGWLIAEGKHLGSRLRSRTCDYGFPTVCDDVEVDSFGLRVRTVDTDGNVE